MNFRTWAPLWSMIVGSSLWHEPDYVIKIFLTMLALKDEDHIYRGSAFELADRSKKTEQEVLDALKILASPDRRRIEKQEHDGRRIQAVEDGWFVLNGEKYREMVQREMKRARDRRAAKAYRARQKIITRFVPRHPSPGEPAMHEDFVDGAGKMAEDRLEELKSIKRGTACTTQAA